MILTTFYPLYHTSKESQPPCITVRFASDACYRCKTMTKVCGISENSYLLLFCQWCWHGLKW